MNKIEKSDIVYIKSDNLLQDAQHIIEVAQNFAYKALNLAMIQRNWLLGKRISEEELQRKDRARYGEEVIKKLAVELTEIYGNGFDSSNLYKFIDFYKTFPEIFHVVSGESYNDILDTASKIKFDNFRHTCPNSFSLLT